MHACFTWVTLLAYPHCVLNDPHSATMQPFELLQGLWSFCRSRFLVRINAFFRLINSLLLLSPYIYAKIFAIINLFDFYVFKLRVCQLTSITLFSFMTVSPCVFNVLFHCKVRLAYWSLAFSTSHCCFVLTYHSSPYEHVPNALTL